MHTIGQAKRVSIYIGESDRWNNKPLHLALLEFLKTQDCAGATVTRALAGFGAHSRIKTASLVALSADLPLKIEWIDNPARVERLMPHLRKMVVEGLITVEDIDVVFYSHREMRHLSAFVPAQDVMSRHLHTVTPDTSLATIVERLINQVAKTLPVVDGQNHLIGLITPGDVLRKVDLLTPSIHRHLTEAELEAELHRLRRLDMTAQNIMTVDPITVTRDTTIPQVVEKMLAHHIKRLPVVDEAGKLVGLVSRVDVLRAFAKPLTAEAPRQIPVFGDPGQVKEVMETTLATVRREAMLSEVVDLLVSNRQRRVVVVSRYGQVVGIITDGDLLKRATPTERSGLIASLARRLPVPQSEAYTLRQRTAAEIMTTPVITVTAETILIEALQLLLTHGIKRLPVIDQQEQLVGLVGRAGILQALGR